MIRRTRRILGLLGLVLCLPFLVGFTMPGTMQRLWHQADRAFKHQQYDQAEQLYDQARKQQPDQWPLSFNVGAAQALGKKYPQAAAEFEKIAKSGPELMREPAEYNAGNCYFASQDTKQAIEHYQRALYLNPNDMNAKWNLELAKRQQKQQQQQQKQQQQQQKQKQPQDKQKQQQQQQQQQQPRQMDKEQAKQLLQSLSQADRDLQKQMNKERKPAGEARPAKDW